jgi:hypothetical protein
MADNGLAALAAVLETVMRDSVARVGGPYAALGSPEVTITFDRAAFAAAILGERGVFLPDGLDGATWTHWVEKDDTIATLRAALDGLVEAADYIVTEYAAWPDDAIPSSIEALRAALAAAKETP